MTAYRYVRKYFHNNLRLNRKLLIQYKKKFNNNLISFIFPLIGILDGDKGKALNYEHSNLNHFIKSLAEKGFKIQKFHDFENARYYPSWNYVDLDRKLPKTDLVLQNTLDMRLSCTDTMEDIEQMANAIVISYKACFC